MNMYILSFCIIIMIIIIINEHLHIDYTEAITGCGDSELDKVSFDTKRVLQAKDFKTKNRKTPKLLHLQHTMLQSAVERGQHLVQHHLRRL